MEGEIVAKRDSHRRLLYARDMQLQLTAELEAKLKDIAAQSGQPVDELVENVMGGYVDELTETKAMLDTRYDDIKSGRVQLIDGEEAFARLIAKTEAERKRPA